LSRRHLKNGGRDRGWRRRRGKADSSPTYLSSARRRIPLRRLTLLREGSSSLLKKGEEREDDKKKRSRHLRDLSIFLKNTFRLLFSLVLLRLLLHPPTLHPFLLLIVPLFAPVLL